jgi:DNA-binding transcriptional LysR family regulator
MHFSLRQIVLFDAIVRLGSLSQAANEVALSQSAASMALKELEDGLCTKLFHRHGRKLILNENGRRLQPKARSLILIAAEITMPGTEELEGMLRVAASSTVGNYVLPECATAFLSRHPKVRMEIITGAVVETVERVVAMSVDLGLIDTTCNRDTLQIEPIGDDRAVVFAAPTHPLARRRQVSMADLRTASWCLRESPSLARVHLATMLGGGGLNDIRFVANNYEGVRAAVMAGLGLGFASMRVIARDVAAGDLVVIKANSVVLNRRFTLIAPKHVYQGTLPKAFADHLRKWFATERTTAAETAKSPALRSERASATPASPASDRRLGRGKRRFSTRSTQLEHATNATQ